MPLLTAAQCDYHLHSTASDGKLSPQEVVQLAAAQGIKELALTDHDTFAGVEAAQAEAAKHQIHLIPGLEFSTSWQGVGVHLVALWPQGLSAAAHQLEEEQQSLRWQRAERILHKLSRTPAKLTQAEVLQQSQGQVPGRPHFAQAMVEKGLVADQNTAFKKWLGSGKLGDIKNFWLELEDALARLKATGAFVSLAHPWHYKLTLSKRKRLLTAFTQAGGKGVEVVSGRQPQEKTASLVKLAAELNLHLTWGSDFHFQGSYCQAPGDFSPLPAACQPLSQLLASN